MRKLILKMSVSLDGFVAGPNGEADWIFRTGSDDSMEWLVDTLWQAGLHAVGNGSYPAMAAFYPTATLPFAAPMNDIPKIVFTKTGAIEALDKTAAEGSWANPFVASGDLGEEIARLKAHPGKDIMASGGANFAQALAAKALIDEYRLVVHSVALGTGIPLFAGLAEPLDLQLISSTTFSGGAMALVYRPA